MQFDKSEKCDYESHAAPPCFYQTLPDKSTAYLKGLTESASTSTAQFVVHGPDGTDKAMFETPRNNHIWFSIGASDDARYLYTVENLQGLVDYGTSTLPGTDLSLHKIDMVDQKMTTVMTWHGAMLDLYQRNNQMLVEVIDREAKTEKLILTDLSGKVRKTLYETNWTTPSEIVVFIRGFISPDGTQAVVESISSASTAAWPIYVLFDLKTGAKTDLSDIPKDGKVYHRIMGWQDVDNLLLKDIHLATSTFSVNEPRFESPSKQ